MGDGDRMTAQQRVDRANQVYSESLRKRLEPTLNGKIVAIHPSTGDHFVADSAVEACRIGRDKYPGAVFVCRRIGNGPLYRVGAF
jgi:hypothetical protein